MSQHGSSHTEHHGSVKSYVIGFLLSIVLTIIPLVLVFNTGMEHKTLVFVSMAMAVLQFAVQLFFFMHVREGEGPKYNVYALILGIVFVVTFVGGSAWIMTFNAQSH